MNHQGWKCLVKQGWRLRTRWGPVSRRWGAAQLKGTLDDVLLYTRTRIVVILDFTGLGKSALSVTLADFLPS